MELGLKNRVVIVTGAASGIGKAIAEAYAKEGAKLALVDLNLEGLNALKTELKDNEVYITVHVRIKYGTNITAKTKELQKKIASGIKEMAAVTVKSVDVVVEAIDF